MESDLTQDEPRGRASVPGEKIRENASRMAAAAPAERPSASATARLQPSTIGSSGPSETAPTARLKAGLPAQLDEAASWLGAKLRTLPDLELRRVELMPGSLLEGGSATSRTVRLVYTDAAGHQLVLVQQRLVESADLDRELPPLPRVEPGGYRSYTWRDGGGYLLSLQGEVGSDSLRALAERVE